MISLISHAVARAGVLKLNVAELSSYWTIELGPTELGGLVARTGKE